MIWFLLRFMSVRKMDQLERIELPVEYNTCYSEATTLLDKHITQEDLKKAEEKLLKLSEKYPYCVEFKRKLGLLYLLKKDFDKAIAEFDYIVSGKNKKLSSCTEETWEKIEAWSLHNIGTAHFLNKNYPEAESYYSSSLNKIKGDTKLFKELGAAFLNDLGAVFCKLKKYEKAQKQYEQASNLDPNNGYFRFNLGESYYDRGLLDKAKESFENALTIFDKNLQQESDEGTRTNLELIKAKILINIGRVELVEGIYDSAEVRLKLAEDIYNSKASFIEKLSLFKRSHENENINSLHNNLGILYTKRESFDEAKKELKLALKAKPNSARTYNNLANVYAKQNNKEMAEKLYKEALRLNSDLKSAKENIRLLGETQAKNWWGWWFSKRDIKAGVGGLVVFFLFALIASILAQPWVGDYYTENTSSTTLTSVNSSLLETGLNKTKIDKTETIQNKTNITNITSAETTLATPTSTKTITEKVSNRKGPVSPEIKLLFVALLIFLLIHPQVKGFSAGTVKFDLVLLSETKGAITESEFEEESGGSLVVVKS